MQLLSASNDTEKEELSYWKERTTSKQFSKFLQIYKGSATAHLWLLLCKEK